MGLLYARDVELATRAKRRLSHIVYVKVHFSNVLGTTGVILSGNRSYYVRGYFVRKQSPPFTLIIRQKKLFKNLKKKLRLRGFLLTPSFYLKSRNYAFNLKTT